MGEHLRIHLSDESVRELKRRADANRHNLAAEAMLLLEASLRRVDLRPGDSLTSLVRRSQEPK